MPVLSEHITLTLASASSDESWRTTTCFLARLRAPIAIIIATTPRMAAGTEAPKRVTATRADLSSLKPRTTPTETTTRAPMTASTMRKCPICSMALSRWLLGLPSCASVAVRPNVVEEPMRTTTAVARPLRTREEAYANPPAFSGTGKLSPVRADWSASISPSSNLQSAGTMRPPASSTTSPATSSSALTSVHWPFLFTRERTASFLESVARATSA
ncbi:Uncharacterised protein [uncultured archaeon]|nr:Uncharacterised protein [uncultured archaeon]